MGAEEKADPTASDGVEWQHASRRYRRPRREHSLLFHHCARFVFHLRLHHAMNGGELHHVHRDPSHDHCESCHHPHARQGDHRRRHQVQQVRQQQVRQQLQEESGRSPLLP